MSDLNQLIAAANKIKEPTQKESAEFKEFIKADEKVFARRLERERPDCELIRKPFTR